MNKYLAVVEKAGKNFSAYAPDLPGCIATGKTPKDTEKRMREAIELHLKGMEADNEPVPQPLTTAKFLAVK